MEATLVYRGLRFGIRVQGLPIACVGSGGKGEFGGFRFGLYGGSTGVRVINQKMETTT